MDDDTTRIHMEKKGNSLLGIKNESQLAMEMSMGMGVLCCEKW